MWGGVGQNARNPCLAPNHTQHRSFSPPPHAGAPAPHPPLCPRASSQAYSKGITLNYTQHKTFILGSVDPSAGLKGKVSTGGRLNMARAASQFLTWFNAQAPAPKPAPARRLAQRGGAAEEREEGQQQLPLATPGGW